MVNLSEKATLGKKIATAASPSGIRAALSNQDILRFEEAMLASTWKALESERFDQDLYLDEVIPKPWGLEFRVYCDTFFDLWKLQRFSLE